MPTTHYRNTRRHKEIKNGQKTLPTSRTPIHRLLTSLRLSRPQNTKRKNPSLPTLKRKMVQGSQLVYTQMQNPILQNSRKDQKRGPTRRNPITIPISHIHQRPTRIN